MQMDEISEEMGLDLQTESLLIRAEQLARLETDKLVDKVKNTIYRTDSSFHFTVSIKLLMCYLVCSVFVCVANVAVSAVAQYSCCNYTILPRIRRERSFHELPSMKEVSHIGDRDFQFHEFHFVWDATTTLENTISVATITRFYYRNSIHRNTSVSSSFSSFRCHLDLGGVSAAASCKDAPGTIATPGSSSGSPSQKIIASRGQRENEIVAAKRKRRSESSVRICTANLSRFWVI